MRAKRQERADTASLGPPPCTAPAFCRTSIRLGHSRTAGGYPMRIAPQSVLSKGAPRAFAVVLEIARLAQEDLSQATVHNQRRGSERGNGQVACRSNITPQCDDRHFAPRIEAQRNIAYPYAPARVAEHVSLSPVSNAGVPAS